MNLFIESFLLLSSQNKITPFRKLDGKNFFDLLPCNGGGERNSISISISFSSFCHRFFVVAVVFAKHLKRFTKTKIQNLNKELRTIQL